MKRSHLPAHPEVPEEEASAQVEMLLLGVCDIPVRAFPSQGSSDLLVSCVVVQGPFQKLRCYPVISFPVSPTLHFHIISRWLLVSFLPQSSSFHILDESTAHKCHHPLGSPFIWLLSCNRKHHYAESCWLSPMLFIEFIIPGHHC